MDREQSLERIKAYKQRLTDSTSNQLEGDIQAFETAIKALEQEPCDKCEVGNPCLYCKHKFEPQEISDRNLKMWEEIYSEEKRRESGDELGEWLDHQNGIWIYAKCSKCESVHDVKSKYCPTCGAKMKMEGDDDLS